MEDSFVSSGSYRQEYEIFDLTSSSIDCKQHAAAVAADSSHQHISTAGNDLLEVGKIRSFEFRNRKYLETVGIMYRTEFMLE